MAPFFGEARVRRITSLEISNLRIVEHLVISPTAGINLIVGGNGAGKTTLLEGIYLAGRGRTFRHADAGPMIRIGAECATVIVGLRDDDADRNSILGVRRERRVLTCRLNGQDVKKRSVLAEALPVQWIGSQPQSFLGMGPEVRRRFIDMGVFHVEHGYLDVVAEFHRVLRQRNAAIRQGDPAGVRIWNQPFDAAAVVLSDRRRAFVDTLMPLVLARLATWQTDFELNYRFRPGWRGDTPLREQLDSRIESDLRQGFTTIGPQRAELEFTVANVPAEKCLSRGQQKMLVLALHLALTDRIKAAVGRAPIVLIDDLAAELDRANRQAIIEAFTERPVQVFLTAIESEALTLLDDAAAMFHVEQGALK
jgi:DNA replication and repair protein RecF